MQRILVVDDADLNRELLRSILEDKYIIDTAEDGRQALQVLQMHERETAAVLLDLHMPQMDGFAVIAQMKQKNYMDRIPVLVISSEQTAEVETSCLELGVSDFIHKPFDSSIVRNRVRNTIELFARQDDIRVLIKKDYIQNPKKNGYRSLHLILSVPIFLSNEKKHMKVEIQFRTIAMDFWASLEHKLKYKREVEDAEEIVTQLKDCADSIERLDYQMQSLRDRIDMGKKADTI